jgi:phage protein D
MGDFFRITANMAEITCDIATTVQSTWLKLEVILQNYFTADMAEITGDNANRASAWAAVR